MQWMLVLTALAAPEPSAEYHSPSCAATVLKDEVQTGTLLFSQGDCLAVKVYTRSDYTHVATVVMRDGEPFVYDSMNGVGVRRQTLAEFLKSHRPDTLHICHPLRPFSKHRARRFEEHLEGELGRSYSVKHYLTGKRSDGLHCSEYLTDALIHAGLIEAKRPARVSPASLRRSLVKYDLYEHSRSIELTDGPRNVEEVSWCADLWLSTKECTLGSCRQLRRWFICR